MNEARLGPRMLILALVVMLLGTFAGCSSEESKQNGADASDMTQENVVHIEWSTTMDCSICHVTQADTLDDVTLGACIHAEEADATCITCHEDIKMLSDVHEGVTANDAMPQKLKATVVEARTCQEADCHNLSPEEMETLTASITDLTDVQGKMVNPHEVMGLTAEHADILCSDCHSQHKAGDNIANICVSCHHTGVYECNTCH